MNTGYGDKFNYSAQAAEAISQLKHDTPKGEGGVVKEVRREGDTTLRFTLLLAF